jgi:hypothetical protein
MLTRQGVRFRGPALTRRARDAFSVAGISLVDRTAVPEWNGQLVDYVVVLSARDGDDAIARVRDLVSRDGTYSEFAPDPP